jgi:Cytochrome c554 and c-prime
VCRTGLVLAVGVAMVASSLSVARQMTPKPSAVGSTKLERIDEARKVSARTAYVGDTTCAACHQDRAETYFRTAHHRTSQLANRDSIAGTFTTDANTLKTSNPGLFFKMEVKPEGFYQTAMFGIASAALRSERFDVVIGSGRKGQTYLYWKGDQLFQLPVSYWVELGQWVNSPGYRDGIADFNRPVVPRCLECHATYAQSVPGAVPANHYKRDSLVLGIACERCHGPGGAHVEARRSGSTEATATDSIVNPTKLPRDRQVEVCAQCHGGPGKRLITSLFSSVPGVPLDNYIERDHFDPSANIDVHGNQVALLQKSRCFQSSSAMNCSTCHNVHEWQRNAAAFSERCLTCHKMSDCGIFAKSGAPITGKCVDCHMPNLPSNLIVSDSNGRQVKPQVRTHWIKAYPQGVSQEVQ